MRIKIVLILVTLFLFAGTMVEASNMGFKITIDLQFFSGKLSQNWVSLPYNVSYTNAADVLADANAGSAAASQITRWITSSDGSESWLGSSGANFAVTPGEAYMLNCTTSGTWVVVGSHNPAVDISVDEYAGKLSQNWLSVPYHTTATNAADLLAEVNAGTAEASQVTRWITSSDGSESWLGSSGANFAITPGEGLMFNAITDGTWQPAHY